MIVDGSKFKVQGSRFTFNGSRLMVDIFESAPKSTIARRNDSEIVRQNEMEEIRTHIGVNQYIHESETMEIMKISIHLVPLCHHAIFQSCVFLVHMQ